MCAMHARATSGQRNTERLGASQLFHAWTLVHLEAHLRSTPEQRGREVSWDGVGDFRAKIQRDREHWEAKEARKGSKDVEQVLLVLVLRIVREANNEGERDGQAEGQDELCLLYTSPSPRD